MVHALVHVENLAIDLSWDIMMRFDEEKYKLPREFFVDWLRVAAEEAKHYTLLQKRLKEGYGKEYGDLPVHDVLWEDALATKDDLFQRLVLEHCIHEARGLDVTGLRTIPSFEEQGDKETAELLRSIVFPDEVTHVRDGLKWFTHLCKALCGLDTHELIVAKFHEVVKQCFIGQRGNFFYGPFNKTARADAGMTEDYYMPFAAPEKK
jgi:uncharacterized ferritin-like protein (DUF455 family)